MEFVGQSILAVGGLLLLSVLASRLTDRLGVPLLLIVLALGMLLGGHGLGAVVFDDFDTAFLFASLALTVILFDGGLRTQVSSFRAGLRPALVLATIGVVVTAGLSGLAAHWLFDLGLTEALLLGAIVGSTDAAAVFYLLHAHGLQINERVRATLEIESGSNDPMAIFLTLALITVLEQDAGQPWLVFLADLGWQLGVGGLLGAVAGRVLAGLINRMELTPSLYPVLALAGGVTIFGLAASIGSSGFLAAYVGGLVAGNTMARARHEIRRFHDGMAWLSQVGLFLMLGLLVMPGELLAIALPGLAIAALLIFVARPAAVALCLLPFRFRMRERAFIAWVGLRGAVPIVLALLPLLSGVEEGPLLFNVAFFVVLVSLLVQGWTVMPAARWLGLNLPVRSEGRRLLELDAPGLEGQELVVYRVLSGCRADGVPTAELELPPESRIIALVRGHGPVDEPHRQRLAAGDHVYLLTAEDQIPAVEALFGTGRLAELQERSYFGPFVVRGTARISALAQLYDLELPTRTNPDQTVAELFRHHYGSAVTVGDRIDLGNADLVASEISGDEVHHAGVSLHPE